MKYLYRCFSATAILIFLCSFTVGQWKKINSGTLARFRSVFFVNANKGWIVGGNGTLLSTVDGGNTWTTTKKFTEDNLRDIYFSTEKDGWILAERDIYGTLSASPSYILKTSDGGSTWEKNKLSGEGKERLIKMFFSAKDAGKGYAVGEAGTFFQMLDDRKTWKKEPVPALNMLNDGAFTDELRGVLVGGSGVVLFTEDGGVSWSSARIHNGSKTKLNSVFFINKNIGWAVGAGGYIYSTNNGGKLWYPQKSGTQINLSDVVFANTAEGWAVGEDGLILHTSTGGNIWTQDETPVKHKLEKVFTLGGKVWAVGFGGTILKYGT